MVVLVKKNYLSYGGKFYESGQSVEIDDKIAKTIIKNSNGDFVAGDNTGKPTQETEVESAGELPTPDMTETVVKGAKK